MLLGTVKPTMYVYLYFIPKMGVQGISVLWEGFLETKILFSAVENP
jgi:hypothetical protein